MARDERLERDVAVKILPRERIVGGRFEREARAAARLSHPGIVTLYEAAVDDEGAYLVSELVRGTTLGALLEAGRLSDRDVVEIAVSLCEALSYAHGEGIVHRDVKPSNVLIPERSRTQAQLVKLTDFGVARVIGGDVLTRTGEVLGTAAYMAPEQAEGLQAAAPADLYALALVVYEALTGVNPVRTNVAAQRARRLGAHLPPLRRQRRELPRELGRAVDLALRPRPRERGTLAEFREALLQSLPEMQDTPGVVTSGFSARSATSHERHAPVFSEPAAQSDADEQEPAESHARMPVPWPSRALAAAAAGAATGWLTAHLLTEVPIAPTAAALLAALTVVAVPRIGWLLITTALATAAISQNDPGAAIILLIGGFVPVVLAPRKGVNWPLAAAAPALGLFNLAGAWPAIAARASGVWQRAALGATGWIWLVLAAPIYGGGLYLSQPPGALGSRGWISSAADTIDHVFRPMLSAGMFAGAPVWALAAVILPYLLRNKSLQVQVVLVAVWAAAVVAASEAAIRVIDPKSHLLSSTNAVAGAIAGAIVALCPSALAAMRVRRANAQVP
jgi:hypothetical protein